jgi:ketosteroid isomerase-like protein
MRKGLIVVLFMVSASLCVLAADKTDDLKKADQDWAQAASARNLDQFMSFVRNDIYASSLDGKWIHGKDTMKNTWSKLLADPTFKLSWTIDSAEVSKDGGMGYTRGTFQGSQGNNSFSGSYATIWQKDKDGKWRAVVDMATPTP